MPSTASMTAVRMNDRRLMARALELARRGLYTTHPNPRVGCVLVRDGEVVGEGYHQYAGGPHAEVVALAQAGERARSATAYVTLEPCAHHGRTPPCADALIAAGVARVVAAQEDPNPRVRGQGLQRLRAAGISVHCGLLESEAEALNPGFLRCMRGGLPWVRVKMAASLDGRTALADGSSQWITGLPARQDVQRWRARSQAVLTGIGTVCRDDPRLDLRPELWPEGDFPQGRVLQRIVLDSDYRTPLTARLLQQGGADSCCIVGGPLNAAAQALQQARVSILAGDARPQPRRVLELLAQRGLHEILIEAGPRLAGSFIAAGVVDELVLYQAPTLLGSQALPLFDLAVATMSEQLRWQIIDQRQVGDDLRSILRRAA